MKFIVIPYIALGLVLSLAIGIEYNCFGPEMFPDYYGSPFVFKQKSLASSMEYYYSVLGLISNVIIWSLFIFGIKFGLKKLFINTKPNKTVKTLYKVIIGLLILFTTLNIIIDYSMAGIGFKEGLNYWYLDLDKEANTWGMECEGKIISFKK